MKTIRYVLIASWMSVAVMLIYDTIVFTGLI